LDVERLLAPISADQPCGADLEYDADMLALWQAAEEKPEQEFGDTKIAAQEPDWRDVGARCEALLARTKHLGVAVLATRAALKQAGYVGAVQGLALMRGLLDRYWPQVYPALDADDGSALARVNALAPLTTAGDGTPRALLRELQFAPLDVALGKAALRVRDLLLALGGARPEPNEAVPTEQGVLAGLSEALAARPQLAQALRDGREHAQALVALLDERAGADAPKLDDLVKLARAVAAAVDRVATPQPDGATAVGAERGAPAAGAPGAAMHAVGPIRTREDAVRLLDQVCEWFAQNEPSHPAPYVIARARRLVHMNFLQIVRDLAPDGLKQVEDVVGREDAAG
jgi:type VI secretion system protein ImpA